MQVHLLLCTCRVAGKTWSRKRGTSVLRAATRLSLSGAWNGEKDPFSNFGRIPSKPFSWRTTFSTTRVAAALMVGVSTYVPPTAARADVLEQDVHAAVSKLIAHMAQDAGFEGTRRRALDRFEGLVDMCMSCGTNRSCHDTAIQLYAI